VLERLEVPARQRRASSPCVGQAEREEVLVFEMVIGCWLICGDGLWQKA